MPLVKAAWAAPPASIRATATTRTRFFPIVIPFVSWTAARILLLQSFF
jgi:hypothetical protein